MVVVRWPGNNPRSPAIGGRIACPFGLPRRAQRNSGFFFWAPVTQNCAKQKNEQGTCRRHSHQLSSNPPGPTPSSQTPKEFLNTHKIIFEIISCRADVLLKFTKSYNGYFADSFKSVVVSQKVVRPNFNRCSNLNSIRCLYVVPGP
jgi:hypothetical protein